VKSRVAVLRTKPETVPPDIERLCELAGMKDALRPGATTILKDNISWHYPFPGANTTPWQLEGTIRALRASGLADLVCVQNNTVVTNPRRASASTATWACSSANGIPVRYNCGSRRPQVGPLRAKAEMLALRKVFPARHQHPRVLPRHQHRPPADGQVSHLHDHDGAMKNAFGGLLATRRHYTHTWIHETLVDLLAIQKEIHTGLFAVMDGTTVGNGPGHAPWSRSART